METVFYGWKCCVLYCVSLKIRPQKKYFWAKTGRHNYTIVFTQVNFPSSNTDSLSKLYAAKNPLLATL